VTTTLRIAVVGQTFAASRTTQRVRAMRRLGHDVTPVPITREGADYETKPSLAARIRYRLRLPADEAGANEAISKAAPMADILWLEAAGMIRAETLLAAKTAHPGLRIVCYSEDDMMNPKHRSRYLEKAFPLIDVWATTKSFNLAPDELPALGLKEVFFVNNGFDPELHRPAAVQTEDFKHDIGFIGTFEQPRSQSLLRLAEAGLSVRVWGNGWRKVQGRHPKLQIEGRPVYNEDYVATIRTTRINLCFLRHGNRDLQTCRSVEIPASGGFMLHEASDETAGLFRPDREAAFFADDHELIKQCRQWLDRDAERASIGAAATKRAWENRLSHDDIVASILERSAFAGGHGTA
jgi:spore maturation protein CgeB